MVWSVDGLEWYAGQRQLLSIARVLLQRPRVLCVDEATAHASVDTGFLFALLSDLPGMSAWRVTLVMIAHSLPSVQNCDTTATMAAGRFLEFGGTEQLLSNPDSELSRMHHVMNGPS